MTVSSTYPPFDPEVGAALTGFLELMPPVLDAEGLRAARAQPIMSLTSEQLAEMGIQSRDVTATSYDGAEIGLSVLSATGHTTPGLGVYFVHGGGLILGDRWVINPEVLRWITQRDAVVVTVDYRLAPEHPDPTPVEDGYAGLVWAQEHATECGFDPDRVVVFGPSAGGGLAAGTVLLARDRQRPSVRGLMLNCPMLDDRDATVSSRDQGDGPGVWTRKQNDFGWTALLGDRRGGADVSVYAAPGRASDLSALPPTFIDCGSSELFRDEDVAFASTIWASGGRAELHIWPGGFHGFDQFAPQALISQDALNARERWLDRILAD